MKLANIPIVNLKSKEGLALINGTQVMTGIGALVLYDSIQLMKMADIISALTFEALNGIIDAFDEKVQNLRPHKGQIDTAINLRKIIEGSKMVSSEGEIRVQDAYSLRCIPQVHGASKDAVNYVRNVLTTEINSVTDNPLIFTMREKLFPLGIFMGNLWHWLWIFFIYCFIRNC